MVIAMPIEDSEPISPRNSEHIDNANGGKENTPEPGTPFSVNTVFLPHSTNAASDIRAGRRSSSTEQRAEEAADYWFESVINDGSRFDEILKRKSNNILDNITSRHNNPNGRSL